MTDDRRRRQYVPLATHFATGRTGSRIQDEYGPEGLAVWCCLLAAAKKSQTQGSIRWSSEADAWAVLGLFTPPSGFTFQEFVTLLGRLKQARTRRHGRESETTLTRFEEWNKTIRRRHEANRKSRKRAQNTADNSADDRAPIGRTEGEGEGEPPTPRRKRTNPRANGTSPRQLAAAEQAHPCPACGVDQQTTSALEDHLEYVHGTVTAQAPLLDDDIPF